MRNGFLTVISECICVVFWSLFNTWKKGLRFDSIVAGMLIWRWAGWIKEMSSLFTTLTALAFEVKFDWSLILQPGGLANLLFINLSFGLSSGLSGRLNVYFHLCHLVTNVADCHLVGYTKCNMPRNVFEKEFKTYEQPGMDLSGIGISSYWMRFYNLSLLLQ